MTKKTKLELTWIGKDKPVKLEPRILIEDPEKSYGDPDSENMLIHGDNLLALKALEQDYTGKVKCIYIDPPYNTGNAFEHYDDGLEHSIWLNLMYERFEILKKLLSNKGSIWVQLDDSEMHYCKVMMDQVFGRNNFVTTIAIKSSTPSGPKTANKDKKIIKQKDYIIVYKKSSDFRINPAYVRRKKWDTHFNYFVDKKNKSVSSFLSVLQQEGILPSKSKTSDFNMNNKIHRDFYIKNSEYICQTQSHRNEELKEKSRKNKDRVLIINEGSATEQMFYNGRQLTPLSKSLNEVFYNGQYINDLALLLCDFWEDVDFQNTQNEGGISFPNSKKPEFLINRILRMTTSPKDIILDSFLGSGTTAAVAHKMGRKWIGIELGEHAYTHCKVRIDKVIKGEDQGGISKTVDWQGGGGYKFYELASSLLKKDKYGNFVIDKEYNAEMLAFAMAKQESFKYDPNQNFYWKQGQSTENDYIYTTTQFMTIEAMDRIHSEMQEGESLLICCKAFDGVCKQKYSNITLKKIPQMLLGRCEFGKEDYSLNIINVPGMEDTVSENNTNIA